MKITITGIQKGTHKTRPAFTDLSNDRFFLKVKRQ